jgi:hypothetical protein
MLIKATIRTGYLPGTIESALELIEWLSSASRPRPPREWNSLRELAYEEDGGSDMTVQFSFNETLVEVKAGMSPTDIVDDYNDRRAKEQAARSAKSDA